MKSRLPLVVGIAWIVGLVLVLGLLLGGSVARLNSHKRHVAALEREIDAKRASLRSQALTDEYTSSLQGMETALLEWQRMIESESSRIAELAAVAQGSGVTIVSLQSGAGAKTEDDLTMARTHRLVGVGTVKQLAHFFDGIYEARGMAAIDELEIEESQAPGLLRASMGVTWYAPSPDARAEEEASP